MADNQALNRLLNILKTSGADAWEVTDVQEKGWEFYLIRHALDQNRVKELESFRVKVYKKFDDCLGSAGAPVPADADEAEMKRIVAGLCQDAAYVRNPFYTLNKPESGTGANAAEAEPVDLKAISSDFLKTLSGLPEKLGQERVSCRHILELCRPVLDRLCPEPEGGWLQECYLELAHGLFPDPARGKQPPDVRRAQAFYLTVLRWFLETEPGRCPYDPLTDVPELTEAELLDQGIRPNTIRLSIGIEKAEDLIAALDAAFAAVQ